MYPYPQDVFGGESKKNLIIFGSEKEKCFIFVCEITQLKDLKSMKTKIYRLYGAVLSVLLSVLGFSSCSKEEMREEYGSPHADYIMQGTVTDEQGNEINGILVSAEEYQDINDGKCWVNLASKKTSYYGEYQLYYQDFPESKYTKLIVQDVDGEANGGEFASDTLDIDYESAEQIKKSDSNWYEGTFRITQNIQLKKK